MIISEEGGKDEREEKTWLTSELKLSKLTLSLDQRCDGIWVVILQFVVSFWRNRIFLVHCKQLL